MQPEISTAPRWAAALTAAAQFSSWRHRAEAGRTPHFTTSAPVARPAATGHSPGVMSYSTRTATFTARQAQAEQVATGSSGRSRRKAFGGAPPKLLLLGWGFRSRFWHKSPGAACSMAITIGGDVQSRRRTDGMD